MRRAATFPLREHAGPPVTPDEEISPTDNALPPHKSRHASPDDEGEEGHKEHISSATFFSHQPLDKGSTKRPRSLSVASDRLSKDVPEPGEDKPPAGSHLSNKSRPASFKRENEIELSIKSEDETQHLHGDLAPLSKTWSGQDDVAQGSYSSAFSASETEPEPSDSEDASDFWDRATGTDTPRPTDTKRPTPLAPQAIDLNPFNHQVGGHTALYRISRHAVCKKLNNRENKFYETVEQYHAEVLDFMPR